MIVTLTGYRGCGKSSVGPLLAEHLGCGCVDSDQVIEQRAGKSIAEIFADDGESAFRQLETEVLTDLLKQSSLIVAAGGGAILSDVNRERMRAAGEVVWLRASAEILAERISSDAASKGMRPSLTGKPIGEEVAEVLTARTPLYEAAATITVDAGEGSPQEIADRIIAQLPDLAGAGA